MRALLPLILVLSLASPVHGADLKRALVSPVKFVVKLPKRVLWDYPKETWERIEETIYWHHWNKNR